MAGTPGVFQQKNIATSEPALLSHTRFNLDFAIKENDVLPVRSRMPVEVVIRRRFPKEDRRNRVRLGKTSDRTRIVELDLNVSKADAPSFMQAIRVICMGDQGTRICFSLAWPSSTSQ